MENKGTDKQYVADSLIHSTTMVIIKLCTNFSELLVKKFLRNLGQKKMDQ